MHYTSWGPTKSDTTELFIEEGPEVLAIFTDTEAKVKGEEWALAVDKDTATATLPDGSRYTASGLRRGGTVSVDLAGRHFTFTKEKRSDWIIEDSLGQKIAQFSGGNNGVRKSITEFEGETPELTDAKTLSTNEVIGLSWFVRRVLLSGLNSMTVATIATLMLLTVVAILAAL